MSHLHTYLIRPGAPLIFRSGKPFGAGSNDGANFPWPSSLAGALRTAWWDEQACVPNPAELLHQAVAGPLLAKIHDKEIIPLVPKPADAVYLKDSEDDNAPTSIYRLLPKQFDGSVGTNLPAGLLPMQMTANNIKGKPQAGARFWTLEQLLAWQQQSVTASQKNLDVDVLKHERKIMDGPCSSHRTHLAISNDTRAAENGKLFQTQGLVFGSTPSDSHEFALLARYAEHLPNGPITLGGERRMSWLEKLDQSPLSTNQTQQHLTGLSSAKGLVLHLVTPALFSGGWKPGWLDDNLQGFPPGLEGKLKLKLVAACLERWEPFSGWDLANKRPRASRKLAPAGSSYWFEIVEQQDQAVAELWLASISDNEQDRRNGFGLVIPGPYIS